MREFNTFGPVNPQRHYHVNRVAVKAALREKIEKGRYLTLNAGRQTGKTTLFREIIAELEATGDYFGILPDFEQLANFGKEDFYERLGKILERGTSVTYHLRQNPSLCVIKVTLSICCARPANNWTNNVC